MSKRIHLVNGRLPQNSIYAGKHFDTSALKEREYQNGVLFSQEGFPDFTPYTFAEVKAKNTPFTANYSKDRKTANAMLGFKRTPAGFIWHHVEDGKTLQLIPKEVHAYVAHTGGAAILRKHKTATPPASAHDSIINSARTTQSILAQRSTIKAGHTATLNQAFNCLSDELPFSRLQTYRADRNLLKTAQIKRLKATIS